MNQSDVPLEQLLRTIKPVFRGDVLPDGTILFVPMETDFNYRPKSSGHLKQLNDTSGALFYVTEAILAEWFKDFRVFEKKITGSALKDVFPADNLVPKYFKTVMTLHDNRDTRNISLHRETVEQLNGIDGCAAYELHFLGLPKQKQHSTLNSSRYDTSMTRLYKAK